jgi:molecular chaperone HtpG
MQRVAKGSIMPEEVRKTIEAVLQNEITVPVTLYLNASNPTICKLSKMNFSEDQQDACMAIYNNSIMLANRTLTPQNAELMFRSFTRIVDRMIDQTSEIIEITSQSSLLRLKILNKNEENAQKNASKIIDRTQHVSCFFAMPFEGYEGLLEAVKQVLEDAPYGWQVIRADDRHHGVTINENVKRHIDRAHCYIAEISDENSNVFMEIGRMGIYEDRQIVYLCRKDKENEIPADLRGQLYFSYDYANQSTPNIVQLVEHLKKELDRKPELTELRGDKNIYLSPGILIHYDQCSKELAGKISSKYTSVETFITLDPEAVAKSLGVTRRSDVGAIEDVQNFLKNHFSL